MVVGHNPGLEELAGLLTCISEPLAAGALVNVGLATEKWDALGLVHGLGSSCRSVESTGS